MKDSFPWKFKLTIGLSIGLLVFAFVTALTTGATREVPPSNFTSLLGIRGGIILIFLAQQMLAAVLIVMTLINRRRLDSTPQYWLGPAAAAILAILILEASFAGGAIRFADLLGAAVAGSADSVSGGGQAPIIYQVNNVWFAVGFFLGSLVLLAFVAAFAVRIWLKRVKPSIDAINKEYDEIEGSDHDPPDDRPGQFSAEKKAWLQRVAIWRGMSQLADQSSGMLTFLLILCSLLGVTGIVVRFVYDDLWNRPPYWIHWAYSAIDATSGARPARPNHCDAQGREEHGLQAKGRHPLGRPDRVASALPSLCSSLLCRESDPRSAKEDLAADRERSRDPVGS